MTDLSQAYNDCASEIHHDLTGHPSPSKLGPIVIAQILKEIVEAGTMAEREKCFEKLENFYLGYLRSPILNPSTGLPSKPDMAKARAVVTKHFNV